MTKQKLLILPILTLVLILASCGTTDTQKKPDMSSTSKAEMAGEMTEDEAIERYRELKDQEAEIFSNNTELWEKVFMAMDKNNAMTMIEDGKNYGDYLLDTIDAAKDDFSSDSEAGRFTENIYAYPTTYVVDRSGNIVGDPIVGAITEPKQAEALKALIDKAIAADMG